MIERAAEALDKELKRVGRTTLALVLVLLIAQVVGSYFLYTRYWDHEIVAWLREILIANLVLLGIGAFALFELYRTRLRLEQALIKAISSELHALRATSYRAQALQSMASTLSATLSFETVVGQALDVCSLSLAEMGVPRESLVGAVFLHDGTELKPLARRHFLGSDETRTLAGKLGVVGEAVRQAEPAVTENPEHDPELQHFPTFANCLTVVCVPLQAAYQLFGVMLLGVNTAVRFEEGHFQLFMTVADQAVIALQNAELYQRLEAEKQRLIEANEAARRELARDLHDGPTQSIAAIAMRLNHLRALALQDPHQTQAEIAKVEELAKRTSQEIRGMLFTLRPLLLETEGLGAALQAILNGLAGAHGLETRLLGGDTGNLLNPKAQGVAFTILEEALSNARKHAQATVIEVRLWQEDNRFLAQVRDDGIGFDTASVAGSYSSRGSLGLLNMKERAERLDGSLQVESTPGSGTRVTLAVPLARYGVQSASAAGAAS